MKTFFGKYKNGNFVYSDQNEAIKAQLVSILNTPIGERFYAPTYGSSLNEFRFSVLNYYTINMIGQTIKDAIQLMNGITLQNIEFSLVKNTLYFAIDLIYLSEIVRVNLKISDGVAS